MGKVTLQLSQITPTFSLYLLISSFLHTSLLLLNSPFALLVLALMLQKNNNTNNGDNRTTNDDATTIVLNVEMHCDGCASRIIRCVRSFQGVETVNVDSDADKLTVVGKLDPAKLRDRLAEKTKKKVSLVSPQPKKENKDKKKSDDKQEKKPDDKKSKEPPVTTAVLKVSLHCQGCIERIRKTVYKTKGVHDMTIDNEKETVTVKGTMDVKSLVENLMKRLKRKVEVVSPKKDKDKDGGGEGKEASNNGGGKKKKKKGSGGDNEEGVGDDDDDDDKAIMEQIKREIVVPAYGYEYGYNYYETVYMEHLLASQMFSDENPNACSVM